MKPPSRYVISLAITLLLPACARGNVDILRLEPSPRLQTQPDAVQVLAAEPTRSYVAIALVSVSSANLGEDELRSRLIRTAARLGGHAVILDAHSLSRNGVGIVVSAKVVAFRDSTDQGRASR